MIDDIEVTTGGSDDTFAPAGPAPDTGANASDPRMARAQIERTRARMSETIEEIEDALLRKKEQIQGRLDVMSPVRERPFPSLGVALGAGILVGLITGGDDDHSHGHVAEANERAELWETRARRLLRIAREQEAEIEALTGMPSKARGAGWDARHALDEEHDSPLHQVRDMIAERLTHFISSARAQTGA